MDTLNLGEKIASGLDSTVYHNIDTEEVYKLYSTFYSEALLNWYAELTQKMASNGVKSLAHIRSEDSNYSLVASVAPHYVHKVGENRILRASYIQGPPLAAFNFNKRTFLTGAFEPLQYIEQMSDETEKQSLLNLNTRFTDSNFGNLINTFYLTKFSSWIRDQLPSSLRLYYIEPALTNVKIRMKNENTIHFVLTDVFADLYNDYHQYKKSAPEG